MFTRHLHFVLIVASTIGLVMGNRDAIADQPDGVVRTFAFKAPNLPPEWLPDFSSLDSTLVVVSPPKGTVVSTEFVPDDEADPRVDGTTWVYRDAMHVIRGPDESPLGTFLWLVTPDTPEPPPTGAHAFTGPFVVQKLLYVSLCSSGDCGGNGNNGKHYVTDPGNAENAFIVVTATFNR